MEGSASESGGGDAGWSRRRAGQQWAVAVGSGQWAAGSGQWAAGSGSLCSRHQNNQGDDAPSLLSSAHNIQTDRARLSRTKSDGLLTILVRCPLRARMLQARSSKPVLVFQNLPVSGRKLVHETSDSLLTRRRLNFQAISKAWHSKIVPTRNAKTSTSTCSQQHSRTLGLDGGFCMIVISAADERHQAAMTSLCHALSCRKARCTIRAFCHHSEALSRIWGIPTRCHAASSILQGFPPCLFRRFAETVVVVAAPTPGTEPASCPGSPALIVRLVTAVAVPTPS